MESCGNICIPGMNIFFLSLSPKEAAELHGDKHVVKMIVETAQMLYSSHWVLDSTKLPETAYKLAHKNHPCSVWVRTSLANYLWLCSLGHWLCKEYTHRYSKIHKTEKHIEWLFENRPMFSAIAFTNPPQAMPDEYKQSNVVDAYRFFYIESKIKQRGIVKYSKRIPDLFKIHLTSEHTHSR